MVNTIWNYEIRLAPVLAGLLIFWGLHIFRRFTKVAYAPSYFAIFPLSMLDYQLSIYFGEYLGEIDAKKLEKKDLKRSLAIKSLISFFITFFMVPLVVGVIISTFLTSQELIGFLVVLLIWQAANCIQAILDFSYFRGQAKLKIWLFFGSFYLCYLVCLFLFIRLGYKYSYPYVSNGNIKGLFLSVENILVLLVISIVVGGVLGGLFTHWLLNKDGLIPHKHDQQDI